MSCSFGKISVKQFALYIKRVSLNVTFEFIKQMFIKHTIGMVDRVEFIPRNKGSGHGNEYNGAIVYFYAVCNSVQFDNLVEAMDKADDGTVQFYYSGFSYWHIKKHDCVEECYVNLDNIDKEVYGFESMMFDASNLHTELMFVNKKCKKLESKLEASDKLLTQEKCKNAHLADELECLKIDNDNLQDDYNQLELSNKIIKNREEQSQKEVEGLKTEVNDLENILSMLTDEVRSIVNGLDDNVDVVLKNKLLNLRGLINCLNK